MSSRPSSSLSKGHQTSHQVGYRKPSTADDFQYDCKAAYLCVVSDIEEPIKNKEDFVKAMQQSGRNLTNRMTSLYWTERTRKMTFEEFVDVCRKVKPTSEDDLMKAFRKIDKDDNGFISCRELQDVLTKKGERMTRQEVQQIIDEVDEDGNGQLDFKEFCNYLLKTQEEAKKIARQQLEKKMKTKGVSGNSSQTANGKKPVATKTSTMKESDDDDDNSDDDIVLGPKSMTSGSFTNQTKPRPTKSLGKGDTAFEKTKPSVQSTAKVSKPKDLKNWQSYKRGGCLFLETDGQITSHQYQFELTEASSVWVTIKPVSIGQGDIVSAQSRKNCPVDTMVALLRANNSVVATTDERDSQGVYSVRCDLDKGRYQLLPFTTGTRLKRSQNSTTEDVKLVKKKGTTYTITDQFSNALKQIFRMCDLDGDGFLNRAEFSLFNKRTSDEEVEDEEWDVVKETIELNKDRIPIEGFLRLNELEAEDNDGDTDDLWVTLSSMGFDKSLQLTSAVPFEIEVYVEENCNASLSVKTLETGGRVLEGALVELTMSKGEEHEVKQMKDLLMYTYMNNNRVCLVIENKSNSRIQLSLDCSNSSNCLTNRKSLEYSLNLPAKSAAIGHHLTPKDDTQSWIIRCVNAVL